LWNFWATCSFVETNSLIVVVHVEVVAGITEPVFIKSVICLNIGLSVFPLITVASFTHVPSITKSIVRGEFISDTLMFNITNKIFFTILTNCTTFALFWLWATTRINFVSPFSKST
jgi:hypothetical protein